MIGKNNLLLKTHTNLFLLYKQGFRGLKKYVESMEKNSIFGGSKFPKVCRKLCRNILGIIHFFPTIKNLNEKVCLWYELPVYISEHIKEN